MSIVVNRTIGLKGTVVNHTNKGLEKGTVVNQTKA